MQQSYVGVTKHRRHEMQLCEPHIDDNMPQCVQWNVVPRNEKFNSVSTKQDVNDKIDQSKDERNEPKIKNVNHILTMILVAI
jgi:hypothetical protein